MINFNIKSIILGIGIGIIITSLISIIYLAGNDSKYTISDEEIIRRLKKWEW
jgi:predicted small secreted protein